MSNSAAPPQPYLLRKMQLADIEQISDIERRVFSMPWSPLTYVYEIRQNRDSYMGVVELPDHPPRQSTGMALERFQLLMRPFKFQHQHRSTMVAYGGMWFKRGEAHISTIATHPDFRGRKLGELMLLGMLVRGITLQADQIALEVRVSNLVAQQLYLKYGFKIVEQIPQYYYDNREDAYLMAVKPVNGPYRMLLKEHLVALCTQVNFRDHYTGLHLERYAIPSPDGFLNALG